MTAAQPVSQTERPAGPRLTVDTVAYHEGRVLLVRRGNPPFKDQWALPGGFVDLGETVEQAAQRETREETGLDVELRLLLGVYSDPQRDPRGHTASVVYLAVPTTDSDPETVVGGDDAAQARWFPLHDPPALAFDHDQILNDARKVLARSKETP